MKNLFFLSLFSLFLMTGCTSSNNPPNEEVSLNEPELILGMTEMEAQLIAEKTCIKGGEAGLGTYNNTLKTWWFDANLNTVREGCTPGCVVSEETKTAEVQWKCAADTSEESEVENTL